MHAPIVKQCSSAAYNYNLLHTQQALCNGGSVARFGEESQDRMVEWLDDNEDVSKDDTILDLGCGNGALLLELVSNRSDNNNNNNNNNDSI